MRARWNDLPLRLRLTLLYVGLIVVLLVALGSFIYYDTRQFLISATASRLEAIAENSINPHVPLGPPEPRNPPATPASTPVAREPLTNTVQGNGPTFESYARFLARDLTWQDTTAVILDKTGTVVAASDITTDMSVVPSPSSDVLAQAMAGDPVTYITTSGQGTLAVLVPVHFPRPDSPIVGAIQMSTPLYVVDQVLQRQRILITSGVLLVVGLATAGGLWLTGSALTPLRRMVDVCRRIAGGDLTQRVNLPRRKDETGQLAAAFDDMVEQLNTSFTTQRQFVADASHELRTPLTAISGSLEVLLLAPEGDQEMRRRVLHGMRKEVARLTRLVTDLLTLTRLDAHRSLKIQEVDLAALAREVIDGVKPLAGHREMVLEAVGRIACRGDADQLKQIFINLIGNAINSTDADKGRIVLRIEQTNGTVGVRVSDNGSGIPEQALPHIFERFYRVDRARARAGGGSGLGLAIVKGIVEAHGGCVEAVESRVGEGTTFCLTLPAGFDK